MSTRITLHGIALATSLLAFIDSKSQWAIDPLGSCAVAVVHASYFQTANTGCVGGCTNLIPATGQPQITRTTNGGDDWITVYLGDTGSVFDMHFIDANTGVASTGGLGVEILRTTNGGSTWSSVYANESNAFLIRQFHFPTALVGYGVGYGNMVTKTTDGGITWNWLADAYPQDYSDFEAVSFLTATNGFVGGDGSLLLHTTDGGNSWTPVTLPIEMAILGLEFINSTTGFAYGAAISPSYGRILRTIDAGASWQLMTINDPSPNDIQELAFVSPSVGYAAGNDGNIYKTVDGGANWNVEFPQSPFLFSIYSLSFAGGSGYAFGPTTKFAKNGAIVGIGEEEAGSGAVELWSNLVSGSTLDLNIMNTNALGHKLNIALSDSRGARVFERAVQPGNTGRLTVDLGQELSAGFYILDLTTEHERTTHKLVVE